MKVSYEDLLEKASVMLRDRGIHNTSMSDVAEAVGLRKASLYSRVNSKEDLVREALAHALKKLLDGLTITGDWLVDYCNAVDFVANHLKANRRCIGLHLLYGSADTPGAVYTQAFFPGLKSRFEEIILQGMDKEVAEELAEHTLSLLEGATLWPMVYENTEPLERAQRILTAIAQDLIPPETDERVLNILERFPAEVAARSKTVRSLAKELAETEAELLRVRAALAGQIEAESCFL
ncbi:Bacterial regulatory protein, tetR family [Pseudovibrio axinellae]|uniref:Bacterial regulatory protein, tetR family n=1 Tax=Pseudovibrio axinellae TaxID=989403 RepID=A0A165XPB8_9HYPH|nr:TetR/AcrR family transcriptional regulator [Pseudovibrio axinellae]KZL17912.1 Bacterial regulatory protein, tetR family [Pseudovibrio axinellae]SER58056.1 transcriptional regulator, TetR family [Pseudovibrio axinellae]